jgi:hypothetical protein
MTRHLLDVCLLAYPRQRRERDGEHLRDLALDLSASHGVAREALSLLRGGLAARWSDLRQLRRAQTSGRWIAAVCFVAAVASAGIVTALTADEHVRVEAEQDVRAEVEQIEGASRR